MDLKVAVGISPGCEARTAGAGWGGTPPMSSDSKVTQSSAVPHVRNFTFTRRQCMMHVSVWAGQRFIESKGKCVVEEGDPRRTPREEETSTETHGLGDFLILIRTITHSHTVL